MNLKTLININQSKFSKTEQEILSYLLENEESINNASIVSLADSVHISKSSILRLTKKLGFSGYSEFKYFIKQSLNDPENTYSNVLDSQKKDIENTLKFIEQTDFSSIINLIHKSNTIYCYGTGYAQKNAVNEFSKSLLGCYKRSLVLPAKTELDVSMPTFTKDDLFIIVSLSGNTEEIKENVKILKLRQIPIISITIFTQNYISSLANHSLFYNVTPMQIKGKNRTLHSFITLNILLDSIIRRYIDFLSE